MSSIIPNPEWNTQDAPGGYEPAGGSGSGQSYGCLYCAQNLELEPPETIYLIGGTSVCVNHISNILGGNQ